MTKSIDYSARSRRVYWNGKNFQGLRNVSWSEKAKKQVTSNHVSDSSHVFELAYPCRLTPLCGDTSMCVVTPLHVWWHLYVYGCCLIRTYIMHARPFLYTVQQAAIYTIHFKSMWWSVEESTGIKVRIHTSWSNKDVMLSTVRSYGSQSPEIKVI